MCSGEAKRAGGGAETARRRDSAVEGGVGEGEEEEEEEEDPQQVGGQDAEPVGVLQGAANGREAHVVAEGVTEHRADQMTCKSSGQGAATSTGQRAAPELLLTCSDEDEGRVGPEHRRVGELKD